MNACDSGDAMEEMVTIDPPPDRCIAAPACLIVRNAPVRFVSITRCHSSNGNDVTGPTLPVPADATAMSRPPVDSHANPTAPATVDSSATSDAAHRTVAPSGAAATRSSAAARNVSSLRPVMVTDAPSLSSRAAQASPMPDPPPVINADRPASACSLAMVLLRLSPQSGATPSSYADVPCLHRPSCPDL